MSTRQYKELGNTGVKVSKIGVGTWQFGQTDAWGPANIEECQKVTDYAIGSGVNFFDTAEGYGQSEKILGELLKGKRDKVFLATKMGERQWDYDTVRKRIEGSLKRLQGLVHLLIPPERCEEAYGGLGKNKDKCLRTFTK